MKRKITQRQQVQEEIEKTKIIMGIMFIGLIMFVGIIATNIKADTITFKFKSPSFNGVGTSSHYLTIENQEFSRKLTIKEEIKLLQEEMEEQGRQQTSSGWGSSSISSSRPPPHTHHPARNHFFCDPLCGMVQGGLSHFPYREY